jgi:hypothetical protein
MDRVRTPHCSWALQTFLRTLERILEYDGAQAVRSSGTVQRNILPLYLRRASTITCSLMVACYGLESGGNTFFLNVDGLLDYAGSCLRLQTADSPYRFLRESRTKLCNWFQRFMYILIWFSIFFDRLCGLVVRVPGYRAEMYCVSCEVRTEFIYVM